MPWPDSEPPWTQDEIRAAPRRPEAQRTPLPVMGERVLFRRREWEEAVPATVAWVQDMTVPLCANGGTEHSPDAHLWEHADPRVPNATWTHPLVRAQLRLVPDPWPRVGLELENGTTEICRESRVRGAPGWLRPDGEGA